MAYEANAESVNVLKISYTTYCSVLVVPLINSKNGCSSSASILSDIISL